MATQERRRKLTIDEINEYWRRLLQGHERPTVHKLCSAIRVLDVALADSPSPMNKKLSTNSWKKIRDDLFDTLITSFAGYFLLYDSADESPIETGGRWPGEGLVEFYPEKTNRRDDACHATISHLHQAIALRLRWSFAEGHQNINPIDFSNYRDGATPSESDDAAADDAQRLLEQLYMTCANEASKLKKIAHRKWWQLHHQSSTCEDRRQRGELKREMEELELVWGRSH